MTPDWLEEAVALRSQGVSEYRIASYLGVSRKAVGYHLRSGVSPVSGQPVLAPRTPYEHASRAAGGCAIEAGLVLPLADHECGHGRLPSDESAPCGCWPGERPKLTVLPGIEPETLERAA